METSFDTENNVVYTDTTESGTFCLVDMEYWMDSLGIEPAGAGEPSNGFMTMQGASIGSAAFEKYRYDGRDYAVFEPGPISWTAARQACSEMGGHLATITSPAEQEFIASLISNGSANNYWLGATDRENEVEGAYETNWEWITGEPWIYDHWGKLQPSNTTRYDSQGEDYLGIALTAYPWSDTYYWNDFRVYDPIVNGYICEWENEDIEGTKYEAFIATRWKTIALDTPLSPDSDTDTDWDVLNFLSPSVDLRISTMHFQIIFSIIYQM